MGVPIAVKEWTNQDTLRTYLNKTISPFAGVLGMIQCIIGNADCVKIEDSILSKVFLWVVDVKNPPFKTKIKFRYGNKQTDYLRLGLGDT